MKKLKIHLLVVCIGMVSTVCGHNPNQIGYDFNEEEQSLTVHFTLRSALDLVKRLCPETADGNMIQLSEYYQDIDAYFNSEIQLQINDKDVSLNLKEAALDQHDAYVKFDLTAGNDWNSIALTLDSYTEIYRRTQNIVKIEGQRYLLDKGNRQLRLKV
ncbi:hypothetical protein POV27_18245 [Aureisphaera galaxeae]|uniref:DUF6702 family protein n=1 Tax=Aureisphaera galaxeae TaxID=1538023 RepID=UPI0023501BC3|nr:DUF6702 family protein [Aureisphaera galaxeae]MDC8005998.1 hypothetical protein [Aureisphaera galaxeae]